MTSSASYVFNLQGIAAIAWVTVLDALRRRILLLVLLFSVVAVLFSLMLPVVREDVDRLKMIESYCLGAASLLGALLAVFLAASSLPDDIKDKKISLVVTKPISRFALLAGKWIGFAVILALFVGMLYGVSAAVIQVNFADLDDRKRTELLEHRDLVPASSFEKSLRPLLPDGAAPATGRFRLARWRFTGIDRQRLPPGQLHARLDLKVVKTPFTLAREKAGKQPEPVIQVQIAYRDPRSGLFESQTVGHHPGPHLDFKGGAQYVNEQGEIEVVVVRTGSEYDFELTKDSLRLYAARRGILDNLGRAFLVITLGIVLVLTFSIACSTFLSAPVAIVLALMLCVLGISLGMLRTFSQRLGKEALTWQDVFERIGRSHHRDHGHERSEPVAAQRALKWVLDAVVRYYPDFDRFAVSGQVTRGYVIPNDQITGLLRYCAIYVPVIFGIGLAIFWQKEILGPSNHFLRGLLRLARPRR